MTLGQTGSALYNVSFVPLIGEERNGGEGRRENERLTGCQCADITFSSNATILSGDSCSNSSNVAVSVVNQEVNGTATSSAANSTTSASAASGTLAGSMMAAGGVAGLGALVMSWLL